MKLPLKVLCLAVVLCLVAALSSCAGKPDAPTAIRALIVPKFEVDEISGDFPGEAQLFYEAYCPGESERALPHLPEGAHFYLNDDTGVAILITGEGKNLCALSLAALFGNPDYDLSDALICSVGCAGGSAGLCTLGDVVVVTGACDGDLGHTADIREFEDTSAEQTWFPDRSFDLSSHRKMDADLAEWAVRLTKDVPLRTTDASRRVIAANFPGQAWAEREPAVLRGTALSADDYWKGEAGHRNAEAIVAAYEMPDPYAVTEMEDVIVANTAACYGLLDRVVTLRVVVDWDVFLGNDSPESLWDAADYNNTVGNDADGGNGSASIDIFEPAMHNLFDVAQVLIDDTLTKPAESSR